MDQKRDADTSDDVVMENSYPSPNADEANYYANAAHRNQDIESQSGNQGNLDGHDSSQHELQQLQREIQDEPPTHEIPVDLAELQLAAQLTQGLAAQHQARQAAEIDDARGMRAAREVQAPHEADAPRSGHADQSFSLPDGLPVVQGQLQNHDSSQEHDLQEQIQAQLQNQQQHELQGALGHPMQTQQHHQYIPHAPPLPSSLPNLNMHALAPGGFATSSDGIPPRKRSKVSRACDECRRKKIKCDAVSETGEQSCSNCRRSSVTCLFSRVPQKRGPSKGYIKELADRIFTIEGRLGGGADNSTESPRAQSSETFPSPTPGDKRPFSSISGDNPTPTKQAGWSTEHRPIQPYQPAGQRPIQTLNDLTPRAIAPVQVEPSLRSVAILESLPEAAAGSILDIDDDAFQVYLTAVHPVFPVFATTKARVQSILSQCPPALRDAFLDAFQDMTQPFQAPGEAIKSGPRAAIRLLAEWEAEDPPLDKVTDLVSLQVFTMMAIRDSLISPTARAQHATASRRAALSRAIGLGFSMKMYAALPDPVPGPEFDPNSDENVSLRAWWTVFLLDRWDAIGTGSIMMIPEESTNLVLGLKPVLGLAGYALTEVSGFFSDINEFLKKPFSDLSFDRRQFRSYEKLADAILKLFKHDFPPDANSSSHPLLYLVYWHIRILSYLASPDPYSRTLFEACRSSMEVLISAGNANFVTPLNHHFASLTIMVVLELSKVGDTQEDALRLLKETAENKILPSSYDNPIKDKLLEYVRPTTTGSINSQNLQQLADLATATDGTRDAAEAPEASEPKTALVQESGALPANYEGLGFDPRPLLLAGYLNYFTSI